MMAGRVVGPDAPGGIPTFSGMAGDRQVHWLGLEPKRADELEAKFSAASPLLRLLILNAYTHEGLSPVEVNNARTLIEAERETEKPCGAGCRDRAIGDTGLCRGHNRYALDTRK